MSNLTDIAKRHLRDRWRDALFIAAAVILTALSIGSVSSKAAGSGPEHQWSLSVVDPSSGAKL
ncbi:MAG TPA: hypothetical protein VMJ10_00760 [Kofleriaceae bacterium]|nr:hypothetical protein [Kofleriaceae bacterium]